MSNDEERVLARIKLDDGMPLELKSAGQAHFSDLLSWGDPTTIDAVDEPSCKTHIWFEIPSALYGAPATAELNGARLSFQLRPKSLYSICEALSIDEVTEETHSIVLLPDSKGRTSVTIAKAEINEYIMLHDTLSQLRSGGPGAHDDAKAQIKDVAIRAISYVNEFIDVYSLTMNNRSLQRISISDITRIDVWQTLRDDPVALNSVTVFLPFGTSCGFNGEASPDSMVESSIEDALAKYVSLDAPYRIAQHYLAESYRALDSADHAMACIHAARSCEEAARHYFDTCRFSPKISTQQKKSLSDIRRKQPNQRPGLNCFLNEIIPIMCGGRRDYPVLDVDLCNRLREARNSAIHNIKEFNKEHKRIDLSNWIDASKRYVEYLIATHPLLMGS